jgi:hypothetical protein
LLKVYFVVFVELKLFVLQVPLLASKLTVTVEVELLRDIAAGKVIAEFH